MKVEFKVQHTVFARPFTKLPATKLARKLRGQDRRRYTVYVQYISLCAELEEAAACS
jgi:hypothetical protein